MHQLESLSIEALAEVRDAVTTKLADRVAARQKELQAEQDRIGGLVEGRPANIPTAPKYRGPEGQTWSGRGSKPRWVEEHLVAGGTLEQLKA